ncbi:phage tail protein [Gilvimarinus chinensis]|uniref:phage tail protein n=1 Tax=Gilvimarinus chinensis TaxID=396005 RepID=UPI00036211D8|nr:tail fiber protein [Gilvimarinus chinensis]
MVEPFVGEISMFGGNFEPRGWAFCNGRLLAISEHSALFSILGTIYGGDGRTSFALPDLRGRAPVGMGQGNGLQYIKQGQLAGTESVQITQSELPSHQLSATQLKATVAIPATTSSENVSAEPGNSKIMGPIAAAGRAGTLYSENSTDVTLKPFEAPVTGDIPSGGGGQPLPIRNPLQGINFIIALEGIYPSRS